MQPDLFRASFRSFRGRPAVHLAGRLSGVDLIMSRRKGGARRDTFGRFIGGLEWSLQS